MKISANREQLLQAFQAVASVAPARSPKPILQNIKLEVDAAGATLLATDMELGIRRAVEGVQADAPGAAILPVQRFGSVLRESSDDVFRIESDGTTLVVRGERSRFNFQAENPAEFPGVATFDHAECYQTTSRWLKEMIRRTIFATDNDSSRYALGGVKLEWAEGLLTGVGTDGRRLARMQGPVQAVGSPTQFGDATIVPGRSLQLVERALADDDSEVQIALRQNEVLFKSTHAVIVSRLLEGRFPRWRDVFPSRSQSQKIELPVAPFYAAVRQAAIFTTDDSRGVDFTFGGGTLVLSGRAAQVGESRIELPIPYDGGEIGITLDPRFLLDFLKVLGGDKSFTLDIQDSDAAAVCQTDDGYGYVIMPLARDR